MVSLPDPLVPAVVDLREFGYMPLDVRRLRDSRIAAMVSGDEFRAAVLLWCAAWHQVPAASLPNDDIELAQLAGFGRVVREWRKVKAGALSGWILCTDGRLYHPVVAEKARESWKSKNEHEFRRECDRIRKENKRLLEKGLPIMAMPELAEWLSTKVSAGIPAENGNFPAENDLFPAENALKVRELKGKIMEVPKSKAKPQKRPPTASSRPDPVKDEVWATGLAILKAEGKNEIASRSFLGKLCKDHGNLLVREALRDCARTHPAAPSEWLIARCQQRRAHAANQQALREERNQNAMQNWTPPSNRENCNDEN